MTALPHALRYCRLFGGCVVGRSGGDGGYSGGDLAKTAANSTTFATTHVHIRRTRCFCVSVFKMSARTGTYLPQLNLDIF